MRSLFLINSYPWLVIYVLYDVAVIAKELIAGCCLLEITISFVRVLRLLIFLLCDRSVYRFTTRRIFKIAEKCREEASVLKLILAQIEPTAILPATRSILLKPCIRNGLKPTYSAILPDFWCTVCVGMLLFFFLNWFINTPHLSLLITIATVLLCKKIVIPARSSCTISWIVDVLCGVRFNWAFGFAWVDRRRRDGSFLKYNIFAQFNTLGFSPECNSSSLR